MISRLTKASSRRASFFNDSEVVASVPSISCYLERRQSVGADTVNSYAAGNSTHHLHIGEIGFLTAQLLDKIEARCDSPNSAVTNLLSMFVQREDTVSHRAPRSVPVTVVLRPSEYGSSLSPIQREER
jgi:hypothetical protein